jgi:phosphoglycolate phosphatase
VIEAVLLDWDGTLVDSRARVLAAHRRASDRLLARPFPETPEEEAVALTTAEAHVYARLAAGDPDLVARLVGRFRAAYLAVDEPVVTLPGARELLAGLHARGVRVAAVTAKAGASFAHDLAALGGDGWFAFAVAGDGEHPPKPDPAPVRAALRGLAVPPERALMVGDGAADVLAARAAGVRVAGALHGFDPAGVRAAGPDVLVHSPLEVLDLVDGVPATPAV